MGTVNTTKTQNKHLTTLNKTQWDFDKGKKTLPLTLPSTTKKDWKKKRDLSTVKDESLFPYQNDKIYTPINKQYINMSITPLYLLANHQQQYSAGTTMAFVGETLPRLG